MEFTGHFQAAGLFWPPIHHRQGQLLPLVLHIGVDTQDACFVLTFPPIHVEHKGPRTYHFDDVEAFPGQIGTRSKFCLFALFGCPFYAGLTRALREGEHEAGTDANIQQKHAVKLGDESKLMVYPERKKKF